MFSTNKILRGFFPSVKLRQKPYSARVLASFSILELSLKYQDKVGDPSGTPFPSLIKRAQSRFKVSRYITLPRPIKRPLRASYAILRACFPATLLTRPLKGSCSLRGRSPRGRGAGLRLHPNHKRVFRDFLPSRVHFVRGLTRVLASLRAAPVSPLPLTA